MISSLKRSKIKEVIEKLNLYKNSEKISDQVIDEICTDIDLKKNDEIIDILLSKKKKNIKLELGNINVSRDWGWLQSMSNLFIRF